MPESILGGPLQKTHPYMSGPPKRPRLRKELSAPVHRTQRRAGEEAVQPGLGGVQVPRRRQPPMALVSSPPILLVLSRAVGNGIHFCDTTTRASQRLPPPFKRRSPCSTDVGINPLIPQPCSAGSETWNDPEKNRHLWFPESPGSFHVSFPTCRTRQVVGLASLVWALACAWPHPNKYVHVT